MENVDFNNKNLNKPSFFRIKWFGLFIAMFWAFFIALALSNVLSPYLSQILNGLITRISPLLIGIIVAFIFYRLVDFTEKVVLKNFLKNSPYKAGIKRTISITIVLLLIISVFILIFSILVPKIISIIQELTSGGGDGWDQMVNRVVDDIYNLIQSWFGADIDQENIRSVLNTLFDQLKETVFYLDGIMQFSMSVLTGIFNFFIGLILAVLILKDKEKISRFTRRFVYANFKKERADAMCVMTANSSRILFDYVICKLIEFAILFVSLGITFTIMGLKFTWELSLIISLFNFIPYFGIYIGMVPAVLLTLIFNSINDVLYLIIAVVIITTIEFNILIPIITGNKLKISALLVASSIIVGGAMFGLAGMLFAPPIVAIISVVVMGNLELKENQMKYAMELSRAREKQLEEIKQTSQKKTTPKKNNVKSNIQTVEELFKSEDASTHKRATKKNKNNELVGGDLKNDNLNNLSNEKVNLDNKETKNLGINNDVSFDLKNLGESEKKEETIIKTNKRKSTKNIKNKQLSIEEINKED